MKQRVIGAVVGAAIAIAGSLVAYWEPAPGDARYRAHQDPIGVWEICYGHTAGVNPGDVATSEQCEAYLREDLEEANDTVDRCITAPMNVNQRAALISFAFNFGPGRAGGKDGLCILKNGREPYIRRMANSGRWQEACDGLLDWTSAGGKKLRGLALRREQERALCLRADFSNVKAGVVTTRIRDGPSRAKLRFQITPFNHRGVSA